jgi:hypothetical protein
MGRQRERDAQIGDTGRLGIAVVDVEHPDERVADVEGHRDRRAAREVRRDDRCGMIAPTVACGESAGKNLVGRRTTRASSGPTRFTDAWSAPRRASAWVTRPSRTMSRSWPLAERATIVTLPGRLA